MNPPNNIQNGFFTPVSPFFSKVRKLTVFSRNPHTPIILQSVRLRMDADRSFVPKTRRSASSACPLQFFGNKKNHMPGARGACRAYDWDLIQSFPAPPDLPPRGRGTARRRWKEFVTITGLRGIATMRCICICELHCCRLGNVESSSADDGTRSARPRGLGGDFEFLPLKSPRNPITPFETSRVSTLHPELYKNLREGARSPQTSLFEGGGPPQRWKEFANGGRSSHHFR